MMRAYFARLPLTDRVTHWWDLWASLAYGFFSGGCLTFLSIAARRAGVSDAGMALMLTMPYVGMLSGILLGHLAERHGPMPFYLWPTLASRASLLALPLVKGPIGFLAVAAAFHLLANLGGPAYASMMRSNFSDEHRGRLMGNVRVLIVIVAGVTSWVAGAALERWAEAWRWLFAGAAAIGVIATLLFARIRPRRVGPPRPRAAARRAAGRGAIRGMVDSLGLLGRDRGFLAFLAILFVCALPGKLAAPLEPIRFVDELGIGWRDSGFVLGTVVSIVSVAGYLAWPRLLRRVSPFTLLALVAALSAARYGVIAAASSPLHLVPASVLAGLGGGWDLVVLFCIMRLVDSRRFPSAMGLHTTLVGARGLFGPGLGTWIHASGSMSLASVFWLLGAITLAGAAGMLWFARRWRADHRGALPASDAALMP